MITLEFVIREVDWTGARAVQVEFDVRVDRSTAMEVEEAQELRQAMHALLDAHLQRHKDAGDIRRALDIRRS